MRKPETIEHLYLDFDGFFASVEQQARPALRGKAIGIVPFTGTQSTCVIACSREAKAMGVSNVMSVPEALAICPDLLLVPQTPDLYRRAHGTLLAEISTVLPVDAVKSIDELACRLDEQQAADPDALASQLKRRIAENVGPYITCSIGFAANRQLAKIAGKQNKPDGVTIWHPDQVPDVLHGLPFDDIPGIGKRMEARLAAMGIRDVASLLKLPPKHWRKIWRSVTGERLWYALHGYAIQAGKSERGMFGHGRVLPPDQRRPAQAYPIARMLLIKAARRMRRGGFYSNRLFLWCEVGRGYSDAVALPGVNDDQACLEALGALWRRFEAVVPVSAKMLRVGVTLGELSPASERQLDLLLNDDVVRQKWENVGAAIDTLNRRYAKSLVTHGPWSPPEGGHLGGKIAFTRIPHADDFW